MIHYVIVLSVLAVLDGVWLGLIAGGYYKRELGPLMADPVNWIPAIIFYLIYALGITLFVVRPALEQGSWQTALLWGGAFGLVAYATYNLTCLSVIKGYPTNLAVIDLNWGTLLTGSTAAITVLIAQRLT